MGVAIINTLLGMGTVFAVLILIMIVLYAFRLIPYLSNKLKKSHDSTIDLSVNIQEDTETDEKVDDLLLVAIISAAIAAYEGTTDTDGFVVRSIKKSRHKL